MHPSYCLYLLSFLGFPILGFALSKHIDFDRSKGYLTLLLALFLVHNTLFILGYSLIGDYPDYLICSLEYFYFCLTIPLLYNSKAVLLKILRVIGTAVIVIGFLQGLAGIALFIVISQDYETDKTYDFSFDNSTYQTRRYSFGFATLDDTRYTFETYKKYDYLPFERRINKSDFFALKNDINFIDEGFGVAIRGNANRQLLEFSSSDGRKLVRVIE